MIGMICIEICLLNLFIVYKQSISKSIVFSPSIISNKFSDVFILFFGCYLLLNNDHNFAQKFWYSVIIIIKVRVCLEDAWEGVFLY